MSAGRSLAQAILTARRVVWLLETKEANDDRLSPAHVALVVEEATASALAAYDEAGEAFVSWENVHPRSAEQAVVLGGVASLLGKLVLAIEMLETQ